MKKKQSILFLNNSNVPQLIIVAGKLFHASNTLIVKKNISWHLSTVRDKVKVRAGVSISVTRWPSGNLPYVCITLKCYIVSLISGQIKYLLSFGVPIMANGVVIHFAVGII